MKELVTLEVAHRLFEEARNFVSGREDGLDGDSDIRVIASQVFGKDYTTHLLQVCNEVFYVLACEAKGVER